MSFLGARATSLPLAGKVRKRAPMSATRDRLEANAIEEGQSAAGAATDASPRV